MNDTFVSIFFDIDSDKKGVISKEQLMHYQRENKYEDSFSTKWLDLFDRKKTGKITLQEFCEVLGIEYADVKKRQGEFQHADKIPADVHVIVADMAIKREIRIIEITREGLSKHDKLKDVAKYIKQACDKEFGSLWHLVIVRGQYWSYYSYEPGNNFVFKLAGHVYVVFKTPIPS